MARHIRGPLGLFLCLPLCASSAGGCGDDSVSTASSASASDGTDGTTGTTTVATATTGESEGSGSASVGETTSSTSETTDITSSTGDPTTDTSTGTTTDEPTTGTERGCGDGVLDDGETCDDGELNGDEAACKLDCTDNVCGDGALFVDVEACDDGNTDDDDGCSALCFLEVCGDGVIQPGLGEACDDGNVDDDDGCSALCSLESCGDGVLQPGLGETCDDGNVDDEDGCSALCVIESCGDGVLQPGLGESCDDGNVDDGDGCDASCQDEPKNLCPGGTISLLVNPGFETGAVAPWQSNGVPTVTDLAHSGAWAAQTTGNVHVEQTFAPTPVSSLDSASFWSWHVSADSPAMSVEWVYSDNSTGSTFYGANQLNGWQEHNILDKLAANKSLVSLRVWGYAGGQDLPDITRFDDFALCRNP